MIEIDGSMGEGGGAVLRVALALSAVSGQAVRIYNIRARRDNPGLQHQHLSSVEALAMISDAKVEGAHLNSMELTFEPGRIKGGRYRVSIGTAGSTILAIQPLMIASAFADRPVEVEVTGGTDNPKAPPVDYLRHVTVPVLKRMGYQVDLKCLRRGHYPRGGGVVVARMEPVGEFLPIAMLDCGKVKEIKGISHCVRLPEHVARRMAHSASITLLRAGYPNVRIETESYPPSEDPHLGPGAGITLWAQTERGCVIGSSALGAPGKPAEQVGVEAAQQLIRSLDTSCAVDRHLADQVVPYMALADGISEVTCSELTSHALTNVKIAEHILGIRFKVEGSTGSPGKLGVKGIGLKKDGNAQCKKEDQDE
ncbi:MAG: RNA 3'-terminal phosphate cyclase [Candidatus Hadarchaeales archaeon]